MNKILALRSGLFGEYSKSNSLIDYFLSNHASDNIVERDLIADALPILDAEIAQGLTGQGDLSDRQKSVLSLSNLLIEELKEADQLIIGVPMYNFSIPTQLKNWIDLVVRAGVTFRYAESGPEGLIENKKTTIITTRGGFHEGQVSDAMITQLKVVLGLIGITDIHVVYAEGLNISEEISTANIEKAKEALA